MELTAMKKALTQLEMELHAYNHAIGCLSFDGATVSPSGSGEARGLTLSFLSQKRYAALVNPKARELLDGLWGRSQELDAATLRRVQLLREDLDEITRIPMEEYAAYVRITNECGERWRAAKAAGDYAMFEPVFKQVLEYSRRFAGYRDASRPAYDVMLDSYEKGMDSATLDALFAMLRSQITPMLASHTPSVQPAFLSAACPVQSQRALSAYLMRAMGLDTARCALAETEHPFTQGFSKYDVRITTHYYENAFLSSMYSVIHEGGHALYELGIADEYQYTALADGASMGMHESQSRFYENLVGRNAGFLRFLAPTLRELFPEALDGVSDEALIRAANRVQPSLVRTEADEVTYPLHIMARYELEKQLVAGTLSTKDLPEAWNALYKEYLGLDVPNHTVGVLQDMHWSEGMFGYFPTYALGSAYASQFLHAMRRDLDVDALLAKGELAPIAQWLGSHVHRYGKLYPPAELLKRATGEAFTPQYYIDHLQSVLKES